ncbi:TetR/AcrR family transcriptional regulator [Chitinophaga sedimenti]|uniref:TetR/AcrR family transcriptional regulator n=1 Tax=Chitinophaga sedimenti TaxID=2033606 RepID=UPI0035565657
MEVQERILDTAFTLFRQYGTRSVTMDDISVRMGISKKRCMQILRTKMTWC